MLGMVDECTEINYANIPKYTRVIGGKNEQTLINVKIIFVISVCIILFYLVLCYLYFKYKYQ